jgi:hypothetical protein
MQNYIAQRQVEMAGEKPVASPAVQPATATTNGVKAPDVAKANDTNLDIFKHLSTTQMMDHLSRDLVHWQQMISQSGPK